MALLNFPTSPVNGQLFPVNPLPDSNIYRWSSAEQTWRLVKLGGVTTGGLVLLDSLAPQFDNSRLTFNLSVGGTAVTPGSNLLVFVGGIAQVEGFSYTVSGSTITFTSAPPSGSSFVGVTVV